MGLREMFAKANEKKKRFKQMQEEVRLQKMVEDRMKSSNEREYERYLEEQRQEKIKIELDKFRKQQQDDLWHKDVISQKNIFKGRPTMLDNNDKLFKIKKSKESHGGFLHG